MKKVIKLKESDLTKIVKRVIKEQGFSEDEMWSSFYDDTGELQEFRERMEDIYSYMGELSSIKRRLDGEIYDIRLDINDSDLSDEVKEYLNNKLDDFENEIQYY